MGVAEDLHLDVGRAVDTAFQVDAPGAEGVFRLVARPDEGFSERRLVLDHADAHTAATVRGLHHEGIPDALGLDHRLDVVDLAVRPGDDRDARGLGQLPGLGLVAHAADHVGGRTHEGDALFDDRLGKGRVLAQEAVAGVDRVGLRLLGGADDPVDAQVAVARGGVADLDGLVGHPHMQRTGVGFGVDRDGLDAEPLARADHPARDLSTVGNEDPLEHGAPV